MDELAGRDEIIEADVIEEGLMISSSSFEIDTSGIQQDLADLAEAIDGALTVYGDMLVTPEALGTMGRREVRQRELAVSRAVRGADEMRRQLNRDYKVPLDLAKKRYDELMGPVIALHAAYKQRRLELDEEEHNQRLEAIRSRYEELAPRIALSPSEGAPALVPFERIHGAYGSKWLNKSEDIDSVMLEIAGIVRGISEGEKRIDEAGLRHATEAKAVYWQTLDVNAAIARDSELCALEERQAALDEDCRAKEEKTAAGAMQPTPQPPTPAAAPATQPIVPVETPAQERKPRVMIIDGATDDECRAIGEFCRSLGITGVFKGPRFHEAVTRLQ